MADIGVGLIGYGLGGRVFHAPFVEAVEGMSLRAVVSSDAAKVHAQLPDVTVVPSVEALLAHPGIDLVIISSPDEMHADHALAAINAGKNVLIDKPFATTLADARKVAAAADAAGTKLTILQNRRWDADFLTVKRLIAEGRLGHVVHFESHFDRWRPEVPAIWKEARVGGSWLDFGAHLVDQVICLFGKPQAITAHLATFREAAPAPDWVHAILHYPDMRAILHSNKLTANHDLRFAVHGTGGSWIKHGFDTQEPLLVAGGKPGDEGMGVDDSLGIYTPANDITLREPIPNEPGDYRHFWRAFELFLRGEGPNPVPPAQALDTVEVLEAGMRSAEQGVTITV